MPNQNHNLRVCYIAYCCRATKLIKIVRMTQNSENDSHKVARSVMHGTQILKICRYIQNFSPFFNSRK